MVRLSKKIKSDSEANRHQKRMSAKGGKRIGAGRPKGATSSVRPKIVDFVTKKEVTELVATAKKHAKEGKPELLKFLLEQIFGKAPQGLDLTTGGKEFPRPLLYALRHNDGDRKDSEA